MVSGKMNDKRRRKQQGRVQRCFEVWRKNHTVFAEELL
jgi:hypothetical protein